MSCIGLATSPDLHSWTDRGPAFCTEDVCPAAPDPHACNAIDPHAFVSGGRSWMVFGSFWSGIKLVELNATSGLLPVWGDGQRPRVWPVAENLQDAPRSIEASWIEHDAASGWHFLFVNWGLCCRGVNSTYSIHVGRSKAVTGPYLDRAGRDMAQGGGTLLLGSQGRFIGPGQTGLLRNGSGWLLSMHYYDGQDAGEPKLRVVGLAVGGGGWPVVVH